MGNAKQITENVRLVKLLLVVLMMSVGTTLLLGCGKNKGQVVGTPGEQCDPAKEDCVEDDKPRSDDIWKFGTGYINYPGDYWTPPMFLTLDLDLYLVSSESAATTQAISVEPVDGVEAEGALWIERDLYLVCDYWGGSQVAKEGRYDIIKNVKRGRTTYNGFAGNELTIKSGDETLTLHLGMVQNGRVLEEITFLPNNYLFGLITIINSKGCTARGYVSAPPYMYPF